MQETNMACRLVFVEIVEARIFRLPPTWLRQTVTIVAHSYGDRKWSPLETYLTDIV